MSFTDELGFKELVNLLTDRSVLLRIEPAMILNDKLVSGVNIEPMDDDCWVNYGHVPVRPGEYILVLFEKLHKSVLEASRQLRSYLDRELWVLVI